MFDIISMRAYRGTHEAFTRAKEAKDSPTGAMADLYLDIEAERWQARRQAREAE